MDPAEEHARKIDRMRAIDPKEIEATRVNELIDAVRSGALTKDDILKYTNISAERLQGLLDKGGS